MTDKAEKEQPQLWRWVRIHKDGSETVASEDFELGYQSEKTKDFIEVLRSKGAELALRRSPHDLGNIPIKYEMAKNPAFDKKVRGMLGIHALSFDWPEMCMRAFYSYAKATAEGNHAKARLVLAQEHAFLDYFKRYITMDTLGEALNESADVYIKAVAEAIVASKNTKKPAPKKKNKSGRRQFHTPKTEWMDADDFANWTPQTRSLIVVRIKRSDVEQGNTSSVMERLHIMTDTPESVNAYRESMMFQIEGYDFDKRELPEIPEVRNFVAKLVAEWPHWLWFMCRGTGSIALLFSLLCEVRLIKGAPGQFGTEFLDIEEVQDRFKDLLDRGCALFDAFPTPEEEIMKSTMSAVREIMPD